ncbi:MAG: energy transducer TonB, partial [Elusimicrobia bacterium]|nr:energy transducer TonB [Elusimicrobiota bacterium]
YLPVYPPWARAKNIEASVSIRFTVNPEGDVENALSIEKTSGYPELDRLAMETLKKWKFTALTSEQKQWGTITFKFLLD